MMQDEKATKSMTAGTVPLVPVRRLVADGVEVFYREAGPKDGPVLILLHGFPASSFQYR